MKKITFSKWKFIQRLFSFLAGIVFVLWLFGILVQFIVALLHQDFSMFQVYGEVALTLFGFTLLGGIFEKNKEHPEIERKLFDSSLSFLIVAIAFFFMYSLSSVFTKEMMSFNNVGTTIIFVGAFFIAMMVGFYGFILGFLNLYRILLEHRESFDTSQTKNP